MLNSAQNKLKRLIPKPRALLLQKLLDSTKTTVLVHMNKINDFLNLGDFEF